VIRVFLADDHLLVRDGLRRLVLDSNVMRVVGEASDGDSLLARLPEAQPEVLLLDITMPGPGFLELMQRIHGLMPSLRILVVSMHAEAQYAERALKAGAAGYVSKRQSAEELTNAIIRVFQGGTYVSSPEGERTRQVLAPPPAAPSPQSPHQLSGREFEILLLLSAGETITGIAKQLSLSPKTVSTYRLRVLKKLGLRSNADLIRFAMHNDLTS